MSGGEFPAQRLGDAVVVRLPAEVDLTSADRLREALLAVLSSGARALIIDMTATTFCDSAAIGAITRAARRAAAAGAEIRLAACAPPVLRILDLLGIDRVVAVYPTVAEAAGSLPEGPVSPAAAGR
ncbi:MAG TPA: STAS domain-containing protein [Trebonia sp.]|nr:STAS domain-containing protein [Trebonia sp.]